MVNGLNQDGDDVRCISSVESERSAASLSGFKNLIAHCFPRNILITSTRRRVARVARGGEKPLFLLDLTVVLVVCNHVASERVPVSRIHLGS